MPNTLTYGFHSVRSADGQTHTQIEDIEANDRSPLRSLQLATQQILAKFASTFAEDYVPAATFSFQPVGASTIQDETEYLLQSAAMKARLLQALERSSAREAAQLRRLKMESDAITSI